jgi:hypothetical protein
LTIVPVPTAPVLIAADCVAVAAVKAMLTDGQEVNQYHTSPILVDTDNDTTPNNLGNTLTDYDEIVKYHTNPNDPDTDHDGVSDYDEIFIKHTNPSLQVDITIADATAMEPSGNNSSLIMNFPVKLSVATTDTVTVTYYTVDVTATSGSNPDYVASRGTITFNPGVTTINIPITINGDNLKESTEIFNVVLTGATYGYVKDNLAVGTILDR